MTWSAQTEPDADITRKRAHYPSGHAEQAHLAVLLVKEEAGVFFSEFLGPPARAQDQPRTGFAFHRQGSRNGCGIPRKLGRPRHKPRATPRPALGPQVFDPG